MIPNGPFGNGMPYSNFHGMNLDWVIQIAKDFLDQYTHIQDTIDDGEQSLEDKETELEALLDAWYTTHSQDIAQTLAQAILDFGTAAQAEATRVIGTIPADYTELSGDVTTLEGLQPRYLASGRNIINNTNYASLITDGDFNSMVDSLGIWYCNALTAADHQPITTMTGMLVIMKYSDSQTIGTMQMFFANDGRFWYRTNHGSSDNPTWDDWHKYDASEYLTSARMQINENNYLDVMTDGDFDNLYQDQRVYYVGNLESALNMPVARMNGMFMVYKYVPSSDIGVMQIYYGNDGQVFYRTSHGLSLSWERWRTVGQRMNEATCNILRKVVCCGDSYVAGYIVDSQDNVNRYNVNYAWPHYMEKLTGNTWINCGVSGANSYQWLTNDRGLVKAQLAGKAQAYTLSLMINDASEDVDRHLDVGVPEDIGTENMTYYAQYSKIIRNLAAINSSAYIFITTIPDEAARYETYNQAVRDIYNAYKDTYNVHLLDLYAYIDLYAIRSLTQARRGGHYIAPGYEQFAEIFAWILSDYIDNNVTEFIDMNLVPYDPEPNMAAIQAILDSNTSTDIDFTNTYIHAVGRFATVGTKVYFCFSVYMRTNISSGANNILTSLPAPANTSIMIPEHDVALEINDNYLSYTTAWRLNGKHTAGDYLFYYGYYTTT